MSCINSLNPQLYKYFLKGAKTHHTAEILDRNHGISFFSKNLVGANLKESTFHMSHFGDGDVSYADMSAADFDSSSLSETTFKKTSLSGSNLSNCSLRSNYLEMCNLMNANLLGANLFSAKFYRCNLQGAAINSLTNIVDVEFSESIYNTIEFTANDITYTPTQFPQGFDPKTAAMIEQNHL